MDWSLLALWRAAAGVHVEIDVDDDRVLVLKLEKSSSTIVCVTVCVTGVMMCMCVFMCTYTCLNTGVSGLVRVFEAYMYVCACVFAYKTTRVIEALYISTRTTTHTPSACPHLEVHSLIHFSPPIPLLLQLQERL